MTLAGRVCSGFIDAISESRTPVFIGAKVVYQLGEPAARELPDVLKRTPEDRAALIGRLYGRPEGRWLAEALMDIEEDPDDLVPFV